MKLSAKLPQDDQGAKLMRFEDVRGQRYTEIFLIGGHAITHHLVGGVYNTIGINDPTGTGDTCPQAVLDKVDVDDLKDEYDLLGAFKNGPRLWTLDWVEVMVAEGAGLQRPARTLGDLARRAEGDAQARERRLQDRQRASGTPSSASTRARLPSSSTTPTATPGA